MRPHISLPKKGTKKTEDLEAALDIFRTEHPSLQQHVKSHIRLLRDKEYVLMLETEDKAYWNKLQEIASEGKYWGVPTGIEYRPKQ